MLPRGDIIYQISKVHKHYHLHSEYFSGNTSTVTAIDGLSCDITRNNIFGVVGQSGSGKSTLMRLLTGYEKPSSGNILFNGYFNVEKASKDDLTKYQAQVKMIFQDPARSLNHRLTVGTILSESLWYSHNFRSECERLGLTDTKVRKREILSRITSMIRIVGLDESILSKYPSEFSGGQRQRIAITRALIHKPEVLICDEITSSLDASTRKNIINLLLDFKQKFNTTIIFVSHDLSTVFYFCDQIMILNHGKVQEISDADTLLRSPSSKETKKLIQALPSFPEKE